MCKIIAAPTCKKKATCKGSKCNASSMTQSYVVSDFRIPVLGILLDGKLHPAVRRAPALVVHPGGDSSAAA